MNSAEIYIKKNKKNFPLFCFDFDYRIFTKSRTSKKNTEVCKRKKIPLVYFCANVGKFISKIQ